MSTTNEVTDSTAGIADRARRLAGAALRTSGELFSDGTALELVKDPTGAGLTLLHWDGSRVITEPRFERDGNAYLALRVNRRLTRELFLPSRATRHKHTDQLLAEIETLFKRCFNLVGSGATLLSLPRCC
jgi:hypothetical protein